jgi:NAD(P)-dependent dehydrogenase (short-subunit alcohol dehydrogenase family)
MGSHAVPALLAQTRSLNSHSRGCMDRLKNKVALVVGAGQAPGGTPGNGRAVAIRFAQEGATVVAVDMLADRAEATAALVRETGRPCLAIAADIRLEADVERMVRSTLEAFGRIDVLHNNVGVFGNDAPVASISVEGFDEILAINLRGMVLTCKHVLPVMQERQSGVVLNVSSGAATNTYRDIAYKTSKAGVVALTQSIANQYAAHGVRANCILPGLIDTPMAIEPRTKGDESLRGGIRAARDAKVPLRHKMGTAWDVANAAVFLASDEAGFITGVNLPVDGGATAQVGVGTPAYPAG